MGKIRSWKTLMILWVMCMSLVGTAFALRGYLSQSKAPQFRRTLLSNRYVTNFPQSGLSAALAANKDSVTMAVSRGESRASFALAFSQSRADQTADGVSYQTRDSGTSVRYQTIPEGIKEEIILTAPPKRIPLVSTLTLSNAEPRLTAEGQIVFVDPNGDYQFHIRQPFASDAAGNITYDIRYRLADYEDVYPTATKNIMQQTGIARQLFGPFPQSQGIPNLTNTYMLVLDMDPAWLNDPARKYPITIDPTVVHDTSAEFAAGQLNRITDTGSGSSPVLETYYQELPADEHTIGLWHANNNWNDASGNGNTGTAQGNTTFTTSALLGGYAGSFDGTDDSVQVPDNAYTSVTGTALTLEAWVYLNSSTTNVTPIIHKGLHYTMAIWNNALTYSDSINYSYSNNGSYGTIPTQKWTHLAVTFDGQNRYHYIDGQLVGIKNYPGSIIDNAVPLLFGCYDDTGAGGATCSDANSFNGRIDEIQILKRVKSPEEIKLDASRRPYSVYTSDVIDLTYVSSWNSLSWTELGVATGDGETLKDATSLVAQWNFNETSGTTADNAEGTAALDGTLTDFDSTASQDADPDSSWTANNRRWGAGALQFDGVNSYVEIGGSTLSTGDKTLSLWMNMRSKGTDYSVITTNSIGLSSNTAGIDISYVTASGANYLSFVVGNGADANQYLNCTGRPLNVGEWYHIALVQSSSALYGYVNGQEYCSDTSASGTEATDASPLRFGTRNFAVDYLFNGTIDAVQAYSRALTAAEILSNYNSSNIELQTRVGADTSPDDGSWEAWKPTTSETAVESYDSNPSPDYYTTLLLHGDGTDASTVFTDNALYPKPITAAGNAQIDTAQSKFGGASILLDGTGDYLSTTDHTDFDFGTGNWTIDFWMRRNGDMNNYNGLVSTALTAGSGWTIMSSAAGDTNKVRLVSNASGSFTNDIVSNTTIADLTWTHVAVVRNGNTVTMYFDGTSVGSGIVTGYTYNGASGAATVIGRAYADNDNYYFNGWIDEVRISKGIARWTTNFTPPTSAYDNLSQIESTTDTNIKVEGTSSNKLINGRAKLDGSTVALWHLDETNGDNAGVDVFDATANNNDGEFNGTNIATGVVDGIFGKARNFINASNDYILLPASSTFDLQRFTIEAWVNPTTTAQSGFIFEKTTNGTVNTQYSCFFNSDGTFYFRTFNSSAVQDDLTFSSSSHFQANQWNHLACVYDGSTKAVYVNGVLAASKSYSQTLQTNPAGTSIIGAYGSGTAYFFDGKIDEVKISSVARTAEEIAETFRAGRDHYINKTLSSTDLSAKKSLPFYVAADRPGTYLETTIGESAFANNQPDINTVGLWHLGENDQKRQYNFPNTTISAADWVEIDPGANKISQNNGLVLSTGTVAAWDSAVISQHTYTRTEGLRLYGKFTAGASVAPNNYMMFGFAQNNTGVASYTNVTHALYFASGSFYVYQDGVSFGGPYGSGYAANTTYEATITLAANGTASYAIKGGAYTNWTTLLASDNAKSNTPLRVQVAQYQTAGTFNEISVYTPVSIKDASGNGNNGTSVGTTFTQGKIGGGRNFNGTSDYVDVGSGTTLNFGSNNFTYEAWIKTTTSGTTRWILSQDANNNNARIIYLNTSSQAVFFCRDSAGNAISATSVPAVNDGIWHHVAGVRNGSTGYLYVDGGLAATATNASTGSCDGGTSTRIGARNAATPYYFTGSIDEAKISNTARTAAEIRQAYEVGLRTHPVTIDFAASLDSGNLIADTNDLSFTVDATVYGLQQQGDKLFLGDKIIVRENYDGTEYIAQGTVTAVTAATGAVTVAAWDAGSTFPSGGYTANASVFKWQREYFDISNLTLDEYMDGITQLTLRLTNGDEGRTIWLDDLKSAGDFLTTPGGSTITSSTGNRYFQYRVIEHSLEESVSASLTAVTLDYVTNVAPNTPSLDAPIDTATDQSLTPALLTTTTDADSDYLKYKIELCTDLAMTTNCQTFDQTASQTGWSGKDAEGSTAYASGTQATYTVQTPLTAATTYFWRSYAIDPGGINTWSSTQGTPYSFTTTATPTAPTSLLAEGTTNPTNVADSTPELSAVYNDSDVGDIANKYEIQVDDNSDFSSVYWDSGAAGTSMTNCTAGARCSDISYAGSALAQGTTYYWRIKFWDDGAAEGAWSTETATFVLSVTPGTPTLDSPANASTNIGLSPVLKTTATDADGDYLRYKIELCTNEAMTVGCQTFNQTASQTGWSNQNAQSGTAYTSGTQARYTVQAALSYNTTYYWRSYAIDPAGSNAWSATQGTPYSFTTLASAESATFNVEGLNLQGISLD